MPPRKGFHGTISVTFCAEVKRLLRYKWLKLFNTFPIPKEVVYLSGFVCLSAELVKNLRMNFRKILGRSRQSDRKQLIRFLGVLVSDSYPGSFIIFSRFALREMEFLLSMHRAVLFQLWARWMRLVITDAEKCNDYTSSLFNVVDGKCRVYVNLFSSVFRNYFC